VTSSLAVPSGDPAAIRQQAAQLRKTAGQLGDLSTSTSKTASKITSEWTGDGAESFEGSAQAVARGAKLAQQPGNDIADMMEGWANQLEDAQQAVQLANVWSQAAENESSLVDQAQQYQQQAQATISNLQQNADILAGRINTAAQGWQFENLFGKSSPVAAWLTMQSGMTQAPDLGNGTIKDPIPEPLDGTIKDPIPEPLDGTIKDPIPEPLDGTIKDPIPEPLDGTIKDPIPEPLDGTIKDPIPEPLDGTIKDPIPEPIDDGTEIFPEGPQGPVIDASASNPNPNPTPTTGPLAGGTVWQGGSGGGRSGNNFPLYGGPAGGVLYRQNPQTGQVNGYAVYDSQGNIVKRVDLTGRAHGGVPTPHVVEYDQNTNPQGQIFVKPQKTVRPATPQEIP
jgi:uncharacterized protein YukE